MDEFWHVKRENYGESLGKSPTRGFSYVSQSFLKTHCKYAAEDLNQLIVVRI